MKQPTSNRRNILLTDKWELKIIPISELINIYKKELIDKSPLFNCILSDDDPYIAIYKKIDSTLSIMDNDISPPDTICMQSLFDMTCSFFPNAFHNWKIITKGCKDIPPLSLVIYFTFDRPKNNVSFVELVCRRISKEEWSKGYNSNDYTSSNQIHLQVLLNAETFRKVPGYVVIHNREIKAYVINSLRLATEGFTDENPLVFIDKIHMVFEKGTWLSEKEEKKRKILFNELTIDSIFRKYHYTLFNLN